VKRETELSSHLRSKVRVGTRFLASKLMVEMYNGETQIPARSEFDERVQKGDRVGAARNSHTDSFTTLKHPVAGDRAGDGSGQ
jgi:hypothetical protein